jgi:hypothetical protein
VSDNGAYESAMKDVALFESALRAAEPTQPDPRLERTLEPRLAATARASTVPTETRTVRRPRSRRVLVARVGIAVALTPLVLAGLAVAGVTVPKPARSAFDEIGISLPNQPTSHTHKSAAQQGPDQPAGNVGTETGTSAPAKGNSEPAHQHALKQRQKARGKAVGHQRGKAIGLTGSTPPGHSGQTGPPSHSNAGGSPGGHSQGLPSSHKPHPTPAPQGNAKGQHK